MHLSLASLGFALDGHRRLAEVCRSSCDQGHDSHCDQQNSAGQYALSCDMHPTTSCDADCHYSPPPPIVPWMGSSGGYPSPPPPPPPRNEELLVASWIYFAVALFILCAALLCLWYRRRNTDGVAFWCCCLVPFLHDRRDRLRDRSENVPRDRSENVPPLLVAR